MKAAQRWKTRAEFPMLTQADMSLTVLKKKEQREKLEHTEEKL